MEVRDVRRLRDFAPWLLPWGGRYLCAWLGLGGVLDLMWFLANNSEHEGRGGPNPLTNQRREGRGRGGGLEREPD